MRVDTVTFDRTPTRPFSGGPPLPSSASSGPPKPPIKEEPPTITAIIT